MSDEAPIERVDVWLTKFDMDHLLDGAVVRKPVGDDTLLRIRYEEWEDDDR